MPRTTEVRAGRWDEIDFNKKQWHLPASRMKVKEKHIVPLSKQALEILQQLKELNGHRELIFPNRNKPIKTEK